MNENNDESLIFQCLHLGYNNKKKNVEANILREVIDWEYLILRVWDNYRDAFGHAQLQANEDDKSGHYETQT